MESFTPYLAREHIADLRRQAHRPVPKAPKGASRRTRDLTRLLPGTAYPAFRRMEKVTGRTDDMMIVRGVNVFPSQVEEQILTIEGLTPHYLCVLSRPGNLDELTVQVEAYDAGADRDALGRALADRVKHRIGVTIGVEVLAPHALERSLGKAKRISDRRN